MCGGFHVASGIFASKLMKANKMTAQAIELKNSEDGHGWILLLLRFWPIEYYLATIIFVDIMYERAEGN